MVSAMSKWRQKSESPSLPRQLMVGMGETKKELGIGFLKDGQDSARWLQEVGMEEFQDEGLWTEAMSQIACPSEAEPTLKVMRVWQQQERRRGRRKETGWGHCSLIDPVTATGDICWVSSGQRRKSGGKLVLAADPVRLHSTGLGYSGQAKKAA